MSPARSESRQYTTAGGVRRYAYPTSFCMYGQPRSRAAKLGSKDKTCWLCSGFSLCWRGKVGVQGALFTVGHEYPHAPDARADAQPGVDIDRQGAVRQRRQCPPCHASGTPPTAPPSAPSAAAHNSRRVCYRRMSHAIPPTLCRATHSHRWNCNVCRHC